tara:strand:- start:212 stop:508 length:297 start_codon:yes stop_codon:yes gene_type:complete
VGGKIIYRDYGDLLADPDVDAVEVLMPHHLHAWVFMPLGFVVRWPSPALISLIIQRTQAFLGRYFGGDLRFFQRCFWKMLSHSSENIERGLQSLHLKD